MIRLKASLLYFAIVLGTGFVLGMFRVPVLRPLALRERGHLLLFRIARGDKRHGHL